ncbi:1-aminocyclopropane-1-carboxylate deaminase/D-cysteine desulfhydrase [Flocculibacter collagenilyticus]|uniref:1-aminocyclopropane-1-carboxylate deaminase/D-cysteine desulfhydrase n=1 Tax=Flocculibacter collagenilyticus TaxID=2744479 RepID=UPI0018F45A51|nr:pyridoxal-phosphate dependent enzyme [Flocculibacter collagenilyticus]
MSEHSVFSKTLKNISQPSPLIKINHKLFTLKNIELWVKRDDLIHPLISGNKWRKLLLNLEQVHQKHKESKQGIVSFGGPFSNHIHALAAAGQQLKIPTIGLIRGPELDLNNPTLKLAQQHGMQLKALTRTEYRQRNNADYLAQLSQTYPNWLIVPEGGSNDLAVQGVAKLVDEIDMNFDVICTPVGSGGTLAGLASALTSHQAALGICVLKGAQYLEQTVHDLLLHNTHCDKQHIHPQWSINHEFHFGGYAKITPALVDFCSEFYQQFDIPIEPIYSGKMFYGLFKLIEQDYFAPNSKIVAVHTGGLQGIKGLEYLKQIPTGKLVTQ